MLSTSSTVEAYEAYEAYEACTGDGNHHSVKVPVMHAVPTERNDCSVLAIAFAFLNYSCKRGRTQCVKHLLNTL